MKVIAKKETFANVAGRLQTVIKEHSTANVALLAKGSTLKIMTSGQGIAVYNNIECSVLEEGLCLTLGALFSDLLRELPEGDINLSGKGPKLEISGKVKGSFKIQLPTKDGSWEEPPQFQKENSFVISSNKLNFLIKQTKFCLAKESSRPYGEVAFLHRVDSNKLRLVGTDGFRLALAEISLDKDLPDWLEKGICLSKKMLTELGKLSQEGFKDVELTIDSSKSQLCAQVADCQLILALSAVEYPRYTEVIPKKMPGLIEIPRDELLSTIRRVALVAGKSQILRLDFDKKNLSICSREPTQGAAREAIFTEYHGDPCSMVVNGKYIVEILNSSIGSTGIEINFRGPNYPLILKPIQSLAECDSQHVLVPIRNNIAPTEA